MNTLPGGRSVVASDIKTSLQGVVTAYECNTLFPMVGYRGLFHCEH